MRPETVFVLVFVSFLLILLIIFSIFIEQKAFILIIIPVYMIVDYFLQKDEE